MAFTQSCFIRKNTKELREYLNKIGHKEIKSISKNKGDKKYLYTYNGKFSQENKNFIDKVGGYDCGTNEELFKAIAAIRDDTDNNQWFTDGNVFVFNESRENWHDDIKAEYESYGFNQPFRLPSGITVGYDHIKGIYKQLLSCKKATVEELINHFK